MLNSLNLTEAIKSLEINVNILLLQPAQAMCHKDLFSGQVDVVVNTVDRAITFNIRLVGPPSSACRRKDGNTVGVASNRTDD